MSEKLAKAIQFISKASLPESNLAIILGSGLGSFADHLKDSVEIQCDQIPYYPISTVEGHDGKLVVGYWKETPVIAVKGRTHYYEGYNIKQVTFIVRILAALGVKLLIVTNAAGGISQHFKPGDLMLITDHINMMFSNPLIGPLDYGEPRFPDMSCPYSKKYQELAETVAVSKKIDLKRGILYVSTGPSYETRSEVKMIGKIGAEAVSMSTVPEVIAANHAGLAVIGISCITNLATGINRSPLSHEEVTRTADRVRTKFIYLISGIIEQLKRSKDF